ncbi:MULTISPECIES: GNAT family N-acetyltransferase [Acinetobacter]|uniref:GNAT family N-acetyltransferase n=1 Tax=Acinetobacter terrestris TaxID=2529843 RepID=A0ABX1UTT1_9GAMM|nr:GNAT family N-acetyltransferase [Acinetobacter terrestris]NNH26031.1 GNAT family N-acetyltransferase [Acinetobacter terrestris]TCB39971.1 GNAT family N-acetyltransferase [Acinetobacter terrestris]
MQPLKYRLANASDVESLVALINQAYRTNTGSSWTSEQDIVTGDRINHQQLLESLNQQNFSLFVAEIVEHSESALVACVGLAFQHSSVEIGTFCVASDWQNQGIGKQVLAYAEQKAFAIFPTLISYEMFVLDARIELIQYYERCGYSKTACIESYPIHANVGQPLIDLQLQHMSKSIS